MPKFTQEVFIPKIMHNLLKRLIIFKKLNRLPGGLNFYQVFHETDLSVSPDSCVSLESRLAFSFLHTVVRPIPRSLAAFDRLPPTCPSTSARRWSIPFFESGLSDRCPRSVGEFICC